MSSGGVPDTGSSNCKSPVTDCRKSSTGDVFICLFLVTDQDVRYVGEQPMGGQRRTKNQRGTGRNTTSLADSERLDDNNATMPPTYGDAQSGAAAAAAGGGRKNKKTKKQPAAPRDDERHIVRYATLLIL